MIPKKKGFYINQGPIEFETIEDQEEDVSFLSKLCLTMKETTQQCG